jgi:hypothetical protein
VNIINKCDNCKNLENRIKLTWLSAAAFDFVFSQKTASRNTGADLKSAPARHRATSIATPNI